MLKEWIAISLVLGFLGSIIIIEKCSQISAQKFLISEKTSSPTLITIHLEGAIKNPGDYRCKPGTSLKSLLDLAGVLPAANRAQIPFKKILLNSQTIEIPEKKGVEKKFSLEEN